MLELERLRSILDYNLITGVFVWKIPTARRISVGDRAGYLDPTNGYLRIRIDGVLYYAHRLAWFYMTGNWPKIQIDHEDLVKTNNSWINLREATVGENMQNLSVKRNNTSGFTGVYFCQTFQRFIAQIQLNKKNIKLGSFVNIEDAREAYKIAKSKLHTFNPTQRV